METQSNQKEHFETIERRLQFLIIVSLFLPSVKNNYLKIFSGLNLDKLISFDTIIISYIFLIYFLFEILKNSIKDKTLNYLEDIILFFSYPFIALISFSTVLDVDNIFGWKLVLMEVVLLFLIGTPLLVLFLIIKDPTLSLFKRIIKTLSK